MLIFITTTITNYKKYTYIPITIHNKALSPPPLLWQYFFTCHLRDSRSRPPNEKNISHINLNNFL